MKRFAICGLTAALLAYAHTASAEIVNITLSGNSESVNDFQDVFGLGAEQVGAAANITNQPFVETFTLNTAGGNAADTSTFVSSDSIFGTNPPYALSASLTINGHTFSTLGSNYSYLAASTTNFYGESNDVVTAGPRLNNDISFDIYSYSGAALPTSVTQPVSLAIDGVNVSALDSFSDETSGGEYDDAGGTLNPTLLTVTDVSAAPEPATWALMILGFGVAGLMLRRGKQPSGLGADIATS